MLQSQDFYHYSFLNGCLIGSEHPASLGWPKQVVEHFVAARGVRALITLTEEFQSYGVPGLQQHHVPIAGTPTRQEVEPAVALIREHLSRDERVWVHCQHGIDRTGCVIGCYLASAGQPPERVVTELFERFPERRRHPLYVELWRPYAELIRSFWRPPVATPASRRKPS